MIETTSELRIPGATPLSVRAWSQASGKSHHWWIFPIGWLSNGTPFSIEQSGGDFDEIFMGHLNIESQNGLVEVRTWGKETRFNLSSETWSEKTKHFLITNWVKILTVSLLLAGSFVVKFGGMIQDADVSKPEDKLQNWTLPLNELAVKHSNVGKAWQIIASLTLDIQFFLVLFFWLWKGFSFRIIIALVLFYAIRAILQQLFILPFPEHFYWEYPGFPWLMNMYGKQSDFFYSGHVGFSLLCTIENFRLGAKKWGIFGIWATIFQWFTLITFRVHYTVDLFAGLIIAHYWFYLSGFVWDWVDSKVLSSRVRDMNPQNKKRWVAMTHPLLESPTMEHEGIQRSGSLT